MLGDECVYVYVYGDKILAHVVNGSIYIYACMCYGMNVSYVYGDKILAHVVKGSIYNGQAVSLPLAAVSSFWNLKV